MELGWGCPPARYKTRKRVKKSVLNIQIPISTKRFYKQRADDKSVSVSDVVREVLCREEESDKSKKTGAAK